MCLWNSPTRLLLLTVYAEICYNSCTNTKCHCLILKKMSDYINLNISCILFLPIFLKRQGFVLHAKPINIWWPIYISYWLLFRWQQSLNPQKIWISKIWEIIYSWVMACYNRQNTKSRWEFWPYNGPNYWQTRTQHASTEVWLSTEENTVKTYILPTSLWQIYKQFLFSVNNCSKDFGDQKKGQHKNPFSFRMNKPMPDSDRISPKMVSWSPVYLLFISLHEFCSIFFLW